MEPEPVAISEVGVRERLEAQRHRWRVREREERLVAREPVCEHIMVQVQCVCLHVLSDHNTRVAYLHGGIVLVDSASQIK